MKRKTILIVDDEDLIVNLLKQFFDLSSQEYEVITTTDPFEALRIFKENDIDLVLSDYHMPGLNGIQLVKELYKIKPIPVILISGSSKAQGITTEFDALNALNSIFFKKPFQPSEILGGVNKLLYA